MAVAVEAAATAVGGEKELASRTNRSAREGSSVKGGVGKMS
jgi:hypothetical protein